MEVDLARVDTVACLAHLEARVSKDPSKLQPVEPIVLTGSLEADYTLSANDESDPSPGRPQSSLLNERPVVDSKCRSIMSWVLARTCHSPGPECRSTCSQATRIFPCFWLAQADVSTVMRTSSSTTTPEARTVHDVDRQWRERRHRPMPQHCERVSWSSARGTAAR